MNRLLLIFVCLSAMTSWSVGQGSTNSSPSTRESTPAVRQKTFRKVWEIVRDKFFDPNFNGVDWNKVRERYAPLVAAVKTDNEMYELLTRMLGELHISHMEIITPDVIAQSAAAPPVTTGLGLRIVEGQVVVFRLLPGSSAEQAGFHPGFLVREIDGVKVKDLDDALTALHGAAGTKVRVAFLDERDQQRELTLERRLLTSHEVDSEKFGKIPFYAVFEAQRLEAGIGYIRFTQFIAPLGKKIEAAIESMHDAPGMIIDLRGNGGGDDSVAIKMANHFFDKRTQLMITRTRKGDLNYYRARPVAKPYLKPVVIIVDEGSGSASEQFTAGMQEAGRAYVVGKKTAGSDMDADVAKLPTGAYLVYAAGEPRTPKGVVVEGRGVLSDLEVDLTRAELLKGNDTQLSAAIQYIKQKVGNEKGSVRAAHAVRTRASALPATR